jgi:hypothetical protein
MWLNRLRPILREKMKIKKNVLKILKERACNLGYIQARKCR